MRIVSLLPSATEIVCALGFESHLVGRSHECDFPQPIQKLPACTTCKINSTQTSISIHKQTQSLLKKSQALYEINRMLLSGLKPNVILTQTQCEVCAVSPTDVFRAVKNWPQKPQIVTLQAMSLESLWEDVQITADALKVSEKGAQYIRVLQAKLKRISEKISHVNHPTVVCLEWLEPLMFGGNWIPELVQLAGGTNLIGKTGEHSSWMEWSKLLELDPEALILMPCGMNLNQTEQEAKSLAQSPNWKKLKAVKLGKVFLTDGNQYFNRPGPRLVDSCELLAEILHPEKFGKNFEGKSFKYFEL